MKKIFAYALAMAIAAPLSAQNTFTNELMTNTSDIIGTSRYVSMGGAMGALGAEISALNNNPASIALFRKSDVSMTMGAQIQGATPANGDPRARYTFDQAGFVAAFKNEIGFVNVALNLQKKANYGNSFFTGSNSLNGFSQAAHLAALYGEFNPPTASLPTQAYNAYLYDIENVAFRSSGFNFNRNTKGNLYGLDLNISGNLHDRIFLGATFGIDFLKYKTSQRYVEYRDDSYGRIQDYDIVSNQNVSGTGFNFKLGAIVRPIEDNPLRFGFAIETPTFYRLSQKDSFYSIGSKWMSYHDKDTGQNRYEYITTPGEYWLYDSTDDNYLEFNVYSPWKFRAAIGSTYETFIAWDVEYEYSLNNRTRMGYPDGRNEYGQSTSMDTDKAINDVTQAMLRGVHNVRVGLEVKPIDNLALRAGYNFYSSPMKSGAFFDQSVYSYAMEFTLGTDYINLSAANIFTFGVGYRGKRFYADLAYKYRSQTGDFYPFEDSYQANGASEAQFQRPDGGVVTGTLQPTKLNLDRHNITFTVGYRF